MVRRHQKPEPLEVSMASYNGLRSFIILPVLSIVAVVTSLCDTWITAGPRPIFVRVFYDFPMQVARDFGFLADYAMSAVEQIKLKAAMAAVLPLAKDGRLNRLLRSIDIRTALEDTQRLRYDLG
jgi:hypothetical protein